MSSFDLEILFNSTQHARRHAFLDPVFQKFLGYPRAKADRSWPELTKPKPVANHTKATLRRYYEEGELDVFDPTEIEAEGFNCLTLNGHTIPAGGAFLLHHDNAPRLLLTNRFFRVSQDSVDCFDFFARGDLYAFAPHIKTVGDLFLPKENLSYEVERLDTAVVVPFRRASNGRRPSAGVPHLELLVWVSLTFDEQVDVCPPFVPNSHVFVTPPVTLNLNMRALANLKITATTELAARLRDVALFSYFYADFAGKAELKAGRLLEVSGILALSNAQMTPQNGLFLIRGKFDEKAAQL